MPNPKLNKLYHLYKENIPDILGGMDEQSFVTKFSDKDKLGKLYDLTQEYDAETLGGLDRDQYITKFGENGEKPKNPLSVEAVTGDDGKPKPSKPVVGVSSPKELLISDPSSMASKVYSKNQSRALAEAVKKKRDVQKSISVGDSEEDLKQKTNGIQSIDRVIDDIKKVEQGEDSSIPEMELPEKELTKSIRENEYKSIGEVDQEIANLEKEIQDGVIESLAPAGKSDRLVPVKSKLNEGDVKNRADRIEQLEIYKSKVLSEQGNIITRANSERSLIKDLNKDSDKKGFRGGRPVATAESFPVYDVVKETALRNLERLKKDEEYFGSKLPPEFIELFEKAHKGDATQEEIATVQELMQSPDVSRYIISAVNFEKQKNQIYFDYPEEAEAEFVRKVNQIAANTDTPLKTIAKTIASAGIDLSQSAVDFFSAFGGRNYKTAEDQRNNFIKNIGEKAWLEKSSSYTGGIVEDVVSGKGIKIVVNPKDNEIIYVRDADSDRIVEEKYLNDEQKAFLNSYKSDPSKHKSSKDVDFNRLFDSALYSTVLMLPTIAGSVLSGGSMPLTYGVTYATMYGSTLEHGKQIFADDPNRDLKAMAFAIPVNAVNTYIELAGGRVELELGKNLRKAAVAASKEWVTKGAEKTGGNSFAAIFGKYIKDLGKRTGASNVKQISSEIFEELTQQVTTDIGATAAGEKSFDVNTYLSIPLVTPVATLPFSALNSHFEKKAYRNGLLSSIDNVETTLALINESIAKNIITQEEGAKKTEVLNNLVNSVNDFKSEGFSDNTTKKIKELLVDRSLLEERLGGKSEGFIIDRIKKKIDGINAQIKGIVDSEGGYSETTEEETDDAATDASTDETTTDEETATGGTEQTFEPDEQSKEDTLKTEINTDINKKTKEDARDIIKGEKIFERFSQEEQRGLTDGGVAHVEASILLAGGEGSGGKNITDTEEQEGRVVVDKKEGFTESAVLNKIYAGLKGKHGDKKAAKLYETAIRLVNPNKNEIIEIRGNGVVVKEDGKYILKPFGNTDSNSKKWTLYQGMDISDQFKTTPLATQQVVETEKSGDSTVPQKQQSVKISIAGREITYTKNDKGKWVSEKGSIAKGKVLLDRIKKAAAETKVGVGEITESSDKNIQKLLESGYGKVRVPDNKGFYTYYHNKDMTQKERKFAKTFTFPLSDEAKRYQKEQESKKDTDEDTNPYLSHEEVAKNIIASIGGKITHKSKTGTVYIRLPNNKTVRISDHYVKKMDQSGDVDKWDYQFVRQPKHFRLNNIQDIIKEISEEAEKSGDSTVPQKTTIKVKKLKLGDKLKKGDTVLWNKRRATVVKQSADGTLTLRNKQGKLIKDVLVSDKEFGGKIIEEIDKTNKDEKFKEKYTEQERDELGEGNPILRQIAINEGTIQGAVSEDERFTKLRDVAKDGGFLIDNLDTTRGEEDGNGTEALVWVDEGEGTVTKAISYDMEGGISNLIDKILVHNSIFPETKITLKGIGTLSDGTNVFIITQPFIKFNKEASGLTKANVISFMKTKGFTVKEDGKYPVFTNGRYDIADLHEGNIGKTGSGNIAVIDFFADINRGVSDSTVSESKKEIQDIIEEHDDEGNPTEDLVEKLREKTSGFPELSDAIKRYDKLVKTDKEAASDNFEKEVRDLLVSNRQNLSEAEIEKANEIINEINSKNGTERLSQGTEQKTDGGIEEARDYLRRTNASASTDNEGGVRDETDIVQREDEALLLYAEGTGILVSVKDVVSEDKFMASGAENRVYTNKDGTVTKVNTGELNSTRKSLLDRLAAHNALFPELPYTLIGIAKDAGKDGNQIALILKQNFIVGTPVSNEDIAKDLAKRGFKQIDTDSNLGGVFERDGIIIKDVFKKEGEDSNVLKAVDGTLAYIDANIDVAEGATIPKVEKKFVSTENPALKDVESTAKSLENIGISKLKRGESEHTPTALNVDYGDIEWQQSNISSFNKGSDGKTYVTDKDGNIYQISKTKISANNTFLVTVKDVKENEVGSFIFKKDVDGKFYAEEAFVTKKKLGIASIAYDFASKDGEKIKPSNKLKEDGIKFWSKSISNIYHKAKVDGSNPELVKAVEDLLAQPKKSGNFTVKEKSNVSTDTELDNTIKSIKEDATEVISNKKGISRLSEQGEQGRKDGGRRNVEATILLSRGSKESGEVKGREAQQQIVEETPKKWKSFFAPPKKTEPQSAKSKTQTKSDSKYKGGVVLTDKGTNAVRAAKILDNIASGVRGFGQDFKKTVAILKALVPSLKSSGIKLVVYQNSSDMKKAMSDKNIPYNNDIAFFYDNEIHIDLSNSDQTVPVHEVVHPIINKILESNPELYKSFLSDLNKLVEQGDAAAISAEVFSSNYKGDANKAMEKLVQYIAERVSKELKLDKPTKFIDGVAKAVKKLLVNLGLSKYKPLLLENVKDLDGLIKSLRDGIENGFSIDGSSVIPQMETSTIAAQSAYYNARAANYKNLIGGIKRIFNTGESVKKEELKKYLVEELGHEEDLFELAYNEASHSSQAKTEWLKDIGKATEKEFENGQERVRFEESVVEGLNRIEDNYNGKTAEDKILSMANEYLDGRVKIDDKDASLLYAQLANSNNKMADISERIASENLTDSQKEDLRNQLTNLQIQYETIAAAVIKAGTTFGRGLAYRTILIDRQQEADITKQIKEIEKQWKGHTMPKDVKGKLSKLNEILNALKDANMSYDELMKALADKNFDIKKGRAEAVSKVIKAQKKAAKQILNKYDNFTKTGSIVQSAKKEGADEKPTLNLDSFIHDMTSVALQEDGSITDLQELTKKINEIISQRGWDKGEFKIEQVTNEQVVNSLSKSHPDSKKAVLTELTKAKNELKSQAKILDAVNALFNKDFSKLEPKKREEVVSRAKSIRAALKNLLDKMDTTSLNDESVSNIRRAITDLDMISAVGISSVSEDILKDAQKAFNEFRDKSRLAKHEEITKELQKDYNTIVNAKGVFTEEVSKLYDKYYKEPISRKGRVVKNQMAISQGLRAHIRKDLESLKSKEKSKSSFYALKLLNDSNNVTTAIILSMDYSLRGTFGAMMNPQLLTSEEHRAVFVENFKRALMAWAAIANVEEEEFKQYKKENEHKDGSFITKVSNKGSGYENGIYETDGGSGTGMTVEVKASNGKVKKIKIIERGTGYSKGDVVTIVSGDNKGSFELHAKVPTYAEFTNKKFDDFIDYFNVTEEDLELWGVKRPFDFSQEDDFSVFKNFADDSDIVNRALVRSNAVLSMSTSQMQVIENWKFRQKYPLATKEEVKDFANQVKLYTFRPQGNIGSLRKLFLAPMYKASAYAILFAKSPYYALKTAKNLITTGDVTKDKIAWEVTKKYTAAFIGVSLVYAGVLLLLGYKPSDEWTDRDFLSFSKYTEDKDGLYHTLNPLLAFAAPLRFALTLFHATMFNNMTHLKALGINPKDYFKRLSDRFGGYSSEDSDFLKILANEFRRWLNPTMFFLATFLNQTDFFGKRIYDFEHLENPYLWGYGKEIGKAYTPLSAQGLVPPDGKLENITAPYFANLIANFLGFNSRYDVNTRLDKDIAKFTRYYNIDLNTLYNKKDTLEYDAFKEHRNNPLRDELKARVNRRLNIWYNEEIGGNEKKLDGEVLKEKVEKYSLEEKENIIKLFGDNRNEAIKKLREVAESFELETEIPQKE